MSQDDDVLLNKAQLAELLGVSRRTVDRRVAAGTAPPVILLPSSRRRWPRATSANGWLSTARCGRQQTC
jgi:predicted DNA-binding transcriptional regulator AlpA